jgi:hypothetical protein
MNKMKFLIILFLIISLECHSVSTHYKRYKRHQVVGDAESKSKINLSNPQNVLESLKTHFYKLLQNAQNSRLFNFIFGAVLKIISLINGNAVLELGKCVVNTVEVYFTSVKFPEKPLDDIKKELNNTKIENLSRNITKTEEEIDDDLGKDMERSEIDALKVDCVAKSQVLDDESIKEEEKVELIDGDDDVDNIIQENNIPKQATPNDVSFIQKKEDKFKNNGKSPILRSLSKKFKKIKDKFKNLSKKLSKAFKNFREVFSKLKAKILKLLDKPIVKTLLFFFECSLPNIIELILSNGMKLAEILTGFQLFKILKNSPKFVKMLVDGFKSLRTGFKEKVTNIQSKYMNYGKGVATLLMAVILGTLGSLS